MANRLLDSEMDSTISPLVDVIFNAMGAMFILLIVYIALVRPNPTRLRKLEIVTESVHPAVAYSHYEGGIAVTGGATPYIYAVDRGELPEGVVLEEGTGRLFGNPRLRDDAAGTDERFEFEVVVRDGSRQSVSRSFVLEVLPVGVPYSPTKQPLRIGPVEPTRSEATTGKPWEFYFGVFGGIEDYELLKSNLPPWMQADLKGGRLFGTPPKAGTYTADLVVGDQQDSMKVLSRSGSLTPAAKLHLEVVVVDPPLPIDCVLVLPVGRVGRPYRGGVVCQGGAGSRRTFAIVGDGPPAGLSLDPSKGILEGSPVRAGRSTLTLSIRDEAGREVRTESEFVSLAAEPELAIATTELPAAHVGDRYVGAISVRGGTPPLRWERSDDQVLPQGLVLEDGQLRGVPESAGRSRFAVRVVDAEGRAAEAEVEIGVLPKRVGPKFLDAEEAR